MSTRSEGRAPGTISVVRMLVGGVYPPFHDAYEFSPAEGRKWIQSAHLPGGIDPLAMPTIVGRCEPMPTDSWEWLSGRIAESGFCEIAGSPYYLATDLPTWHIEVSGAEFRKRVSSYGGGVAPHADDEPDDELRAFYDAVCIIEEMARRLPWRDVLERHSMRDPGPLDDLASDT